MKKITQKKAAASPPAVIQPHLIAPFNFHERAKERGTGVISQWIKDSRWPTKTRANFDRSLDQLRSLNKQHWSKPNPASKTGNHTYVIRFRDVSSTQLRVFGHFYDAHHAFTMTLQGTEKDDVYYPKDHADLADQYRTDCDKDFEKRTLPFEKRCEPCKEVLSNQAILKQRTSITLQQAKMAR